MVKRFQQKRVNIAIFASGSGSNFEAIVKYIRKGEIKNASVKLLITDKKDAFVRQRAKKFGIKDFFIDPSKFTSRLSYEKRIFKILKSEGIDLIVLAGFMRILSPYLVKKYKNKILNIHPALLPAFKGTEAIRRAFKYGVKITGVTVHFVDEKVDHGPIILQEAIKIKPSDTLQILEQKIHKVEHRLYPLAIKLFIEKKLKIKGRKVEIINE